MVPTPFSADAAVVDRSSLVRLAGGLLDDGCTGLVALGAIAEPATLTAAERDAVVRDLGAVARARGAGLVVGLAGTRTDDAVAEVRRSADLRRSADALLVPVPAPDARSTRRHLRAVHDASGLPLVVQDLPRATGVTIGLDELLRAVEGLDFVAAVKCESPPTFVAVAALVRHTDVVAMSGMGGTGLVADLHAGARAVALGATPTRVLVAAVDAWQRGDVEESLRLVGSVATRCHVETQPGASVAIRKEHWRREDRIASASVRAPTPPWRPEEDGLDGLSALLGLPDAVVRPPVPG
ncbi:dihydrodipicolinate synthase family protein [Nocardioides sp. ChNu-153]|uniref:dihydrodipicolinate synthase family protein n=1 Tax=unclassified Nocardioides TaxID=2615069 RepID=UPI002406C880|nr:MULTISPECIES: dihydrodipicolinate synthase family protein [unclassified Nocardioides]MDF9714781.1 dihydrodipicolinate synthase family protein [Nocardioides sp. ChNu-99]MDN7120093.1 dihydrodipicolinate synthase family protein [Nocardioides sp. ChNu-153]